MLIAIVVLGSFAAIILLVSWDVDRKERRHNELHGGMLTGGRKARRRRGR